MAHSSANARLEAFCDGVFAIALTLLIIDIKIPSSVSIQTNRDLWLALKHLVPSIFAFLLSFLIIFITWVNHHAVLKLVDKSSHRFIYANGFILLIVVFIPFPTALLGEHLLTDHASPAVVLYCGVTAVQAISWNLVTRAALGPELLTRSEQATLIMRRNHRYSYFGFVANASCAVAALWFPHAVAVVITAQWCFWLAVGIFTRAE